MGWLEILAWLKKNWAVPVMGVLALSTLIQTYRVQSWKATAQTCAANRETDKKSYESAAAKSEVKNRREVAEKEKSWQDTADKTSKEYKDAISKANSRVADYADRMRAKANTSLPRSGSLPKATTASGGTDGTGKTTELPSTSASIPVPESDLYICAENTVKAEKWQEFWKGLVSK